MELISLTDVRHDAVSNASPTMISPRCPVQIEFREPRPDEPIIKIAEVPIQPAIGNNTHGRFQRRVDILLEANIQNRGSDAHPARKHPQHNLPILNIDQPRLAVLRVVHARDVCEDAQLQDEGNSVGKTQHTRPHTEPAEQDGREHAGGVVTDTPNPRGQTGRCERIVHETPNRRPDAAY